MRRECALFELNFKVKGVKQRLLFMVTWLKYLVLATRNRQPTNEGPVSPIAVYITLIIAAGTCVGLKRNLND